MSDHEEETPIKIGELNTSSRRVYTTAKVISKGESREVTSRNDDSTHNVCEALVADDSGSIYLTLWDEAIDEVKEGQYLKLNNAYINVFKGSMRLNLGRYGNYEVIDDVDWGEVNLDNNISDKEVESTRRRGGGRGYDNRERGQRY